MRTRTEQSGALKGAVGQRKDWVREARRTVEHSFKPRARTSVPIPRAIRIALGLLAAGTLAISLVGCSSSSADGGSGAPVEANDPPNEVVSPDAGATSEGGTSTSLGDVDEDEGAAPDDFSNSVESIEDYMNKLGLDSTDFTSCRVAGTLSGAVSSNVDAAAVMSRTIVVEGGVPLYTYLFLIDGYTVTVLHNAGLETVYGTIAGSDSPLESVDTYTPQPGAGTDDLDDSGGHLNAIWYGSGVYEGQTVESSLDLSC